MTRYAIIRAFWICAVLGLPVMVGLKTVAAQDVGAEIGGGAGIFRPKNPETKKRPGKPLAPVTKPSTRTASRRSGSSSGSIVERVEDLLDKGNEARDARRFGDAETAYRGVLKIKPRDSRAAYGLGNVYTDQQRWDAAESAYRDAVKWSPADVDALVALSVVLVQPRTGGSNASRFAEAEAFARRAVQIQPRHAVAWDRLGVALQSRGLFNVDTEHAYRRAVELDPEFAVAYAHLARVLKRLGRKDEAEPLYEKAIALAKEPATLNLIAESLQAEQQWDNSEPVLKRALELDARNPVALFLMGRMLIVKKRYEEAESFLKNATEISPRAFQPYNLLGSAYLAMARYQDAEKTYQRALELAPVEERRQLAGAFGFEGVGDGYMKTRQKTDAARAYQRALELDPENRALERKLSSARPR
ncbi:MAG TPA: tetratricopeptide repeat protein [Pyrinomonadaceae bacterium]|nr:tetratricopeptide repeat protein [Pyrinomonadaceae bacterium]